MTRTLVALSALLLIWASSVPVATQAAPAAAPAFPGTWQQIPAPPTTRPDNVRDLLITPAGEMYVALDTQGLWRTADAGKTWKNIQYNISGPTAGRFCFNKEGGLLFGVGDSTKRVIYRLPVGATEWVAAAVDWKGCSGAEAVGRLVMNKAGDIIAVSSGGQVLRSTDGGKTFKPTGVRQAGAAVFDMQVSPTDPNEIAVGNEIGPLWRSTDGGLTWNDIGKPGGNARLGYNRLGQLFSSATHDAAGKGWQLARWVEGQKWERSDKGLPLYADTRCFALAPSGLMASGSTSVYVSKDDGTTWQLAAPGFPAAGGQRVHLRCLVFGPDGFLYGSASSPVAGDLGIWRLQVGEAAGRPTTAPAKP